MLTTATKASFCTHHNPNEGHIKSEINLARLNKSEHEKNCQLHGKAKKISSLKERPPQLLPINHIS